MAVRVQVLASEAELEAPRMRSAEAAAPETTLGSDMLFRVVTSADAAYLAVYDASGNLVHKAENGEVPAEGGERAWTMILPMERTGAVKLTFRASADDAVFGLAATAQLTVKDGEFVYQIDETLGGAVLAAYKGASAIVEVPASYCGLPMVKIGQSAFEGNDAIQEVFLPDSVEVIGRRAFKNCKNMKDMD